MSIERDNIIEFIKTDSYGSKSSLEQIKNNIMRINRDIRNAKDNLKSYYENLYELRCREDMIIHADSKAIELAVLEFENIGNMKKVKDFYIDSENKLVIETDMIYIEEDDDRYKIGEFTIKISPDNNEFYFENTSDDNDCGPRYAYFEDGRSQHPHINGEGWACFGSVDSTLLELLINKEYCSLVSMLISYLESVNIDDCAGKYITAWNIVDEDDNIIKRGREHNVPVCAECNDESEDLETCLICGDSVCDDCRREVHDSYGNDAYMCDDCFSSKSKICDSCGHRHYNEGSECSICETEICHECENETSDGIILCNDCYNEKTKECSECCRTKMANDIKECKMCGEDCCDSCLDSDGVCRSCSKKAAKAEKDIMTVEEALSETIDVNVNVDYVKLKAEEYSQSITDTIKSIINESMLPVVNYATYTTNIAPPFVEIFGQKSGSELIIPHTNTKEEYQLNYKLEVPEVNPPEDKKNDEDKEWDI